MQNNAFTIVSGWNFLFVATMTMTTGTMFLMWLGEQITERGIGNGISMIILAGIVCGPAGRAGPDTRADFQRPDGPGFALMLILMMLRCTAFCVYVERAQRRIAVNFAKRQVGRRMMGGQTTHLPFKLNMSGVIPPIFASSLLLFPATIASFFATGKEGAGRGFHAEHG